MPLLKIKALNETTQLYVWKITETFDELFRSVALKDISLARLEGMKAESHQKGFLSVRRLLMEAGYNDFDLYYDEFGKPHLQDGKHISISHSNDFSVIVLSAVNIGADLEILKEKTLKLAPRFMDVSHLKNLNKEDELFKATVVWGIKESVFKIKNEVGISFKDHIFEHDFSLVDRKCTVELRFNNKVECFDILFDFIENYVFVCAFESNK
ncbi:4-phosphopantetheinyl transferase [Flavobacterium sp. J49]|uniref:4'-phosphopantetheinyl transferase family protein n=1 Tax=Flavobacterium sp. J49 TaxID=2718534 RepID=UPI001592E783|nr:4-phosphopantetheinyl transferase [Flavobacterium sp. J49]MBF6641220.1 4-phosphopantetheinyl transferase [Flavobacterium sp. J49]NIC02467.1 4-phosphopantetheinyl transferase [Flavobacterium sp. J49]